MAGSSVGSLRWVIGLPIFIAFTCCLILNAASQLLENSDPALAATLNPLNTDARINALVADINADARPLDQLAGEAQALVVQAGADARVYSVVGAIEEHRGNSAQAISSYELALEHSRTERYALTRMLSLSLAADDIAEATRYFDLLLRRWLEFAPEIAPLANRFIASPQGAAAMKQALAADPIWRRVVVRQLQSSTAGLRFVAQTLLGERRGRSWQADLATTIASLLRVGAPGEAYSLFQQTLTDEEAGLAGYVFDPGFTRPPGGRAFDWSAVTSATVDASLPAAGGHGLRVRFLDSPAKLGRPSQTLYLPTGRYTLSVTASGTALAVPKTLYWQVRCVRPRVELARLDLAGGTYDDRTMLASFVVPADCPLQSLTLETGVTTSSWRDRYGGEILVNDVHIARAGDGA